MARDRGGSWYRARAAGRAARAGHRSHVIGARAFRKLLSRVPAAARDDIVEMFEEAGDQIAANAKSDSPSRRVAGAITKRVSRASLRLRVGLIGAPLNRRLFFARILEKGRKAQNVRARRRSKSGKVTTYRMNVRVMPARPFVYTARNEAIRDSMGGRIGKFWERVISRAAAGIDDG